MNRSKSWWFAVVALLGCCALVLSACGGGSDSSSSETSAETSAETTESSEGSETAEGGSDAQAEAAELVAEAEQPPTVVPENVKLEKPAPTGKTLAWLDCGVPTCEAYAKYIKEATTSLGWTFDEYHGGASPETITNAMKEVVASKPDAFMAIATPLSILKPFYEEFKSDGVPVVMCCELGDVEEPIVKMIGGEEHGELTGKRAADWIVSDGGEEANVAFLTTKDFAILKPYGEGLKNELSRLSPNSTFEEVAVASTDIGKPTVSTAVVSFLRSHPETKYVAVAFDDLATGVPAALQAAGLSDVKLVGLSANSLSIEGVKKGNENWAATAQFGPEWGIWAVDVLARQMNGEKIGEETLSPEYLITAKNAPEQSEYPPIIPDMLQQYEKLWGK